TRHLEERHHLVARRKRHEGRLELVLERVLEIRRQQREVDRSVAPVRAQDLELTPLASDEVLRPDRDGDVVVDADIDAKVDGGNLDVGRGRHRLERDALGTRWIRRGQGDGEGDGALGAGGQWEPGRVAPDRRGIDADGTDRDVVDDIGGVLYRQDDTKGLPG